MEGKVHDALIIGSGPAGLTAGIYCGRANLKTVVIGGEKWGGQLMLTTDVENFPGFAGGVLGPKLMENMRKQCERFGAMVVEENVTAVDFSKRPFEVESGGKKYLGHAVIIATGAAARWLGLPNEQRLIGRGVSSCAPCDAPFFKNKRVAVVGGGDAAMEEALTLAKFASGVVMVHRRDQFRASKIMQERVMNEFKIKVVWNSEVIDVLGEEKVTGLRLKTSAGEVAAIAGEFGGKVVEGGGGLVWEMPVEGMFVAIGHTPATEIFAKYIDLDEMGYAKAMHGGGLIEKKEGRHGFYSMSNIEGVFISGDVHDVHYRQAVTASGFGCMAGMEASRWLEAQGVGKGAATR